MDIIYVILGIVGGLAGGIALSYYLLRKKVEIPEYDYRLLVLLDPAGNFVVLKNAKLVKDQIIGVKITPTENGFAEELATYKWAGSGHPNDFVIGKKDLGYIAVGIKDSMVTPIMKKEKVEKILRDQDLTSELTETIIKLQSFKLDAYSKFFEEYKAIRDALFGTDVIKHVRAVGALCAKMPNLLDVFAEGYIVAKLELGEEDVMQKEELKAWLEDPQTVMKAFAVLVAEELYNKITSRGGKNE